MRASAACGLALLIVAGCNPKAPQNAAPQPSGENAPQAGIGAQVQRGKERQEVQNDFHQLAQFYNLYQTENNRPPTPEQLKAQVKKEAPRIYQAIEDGRYVLVPNPVRNPSAVLVYEKEADFNHNRIAALADGSVKLMNESEFDAALKNKGG